MTGTTPRRPGHDLALRVVRLALVAFLVALPFWLLNCDPLIDGHGYAGDETMTLTMAMSAATTGIEAYGNNPDGTPWQWSVRLPLWKVAYGLALAGAMPIERIETGRLASRVLTLLGVEVWVFTALYLIWGRIRAAPLLQACSLGFLSSLAFASLEPLVFVGSFARNDSLGFLLVCVTFLAGVVYLRSHQSLWATSFLWTVASLGFWGHFAALLYSLLLSSWVWLLGAVCAKRAASVRSFLRHSIAGIAVAGALFTLLRMLVNSGSARPEVVSAVPLSSLGNVVSTYSSKLLANLLDSTALERGLLKWLEFSEVLVVFSVWCVISVGVVYRGRGATHRRELLAKVLRGLIEPAFLLLYLSLVAGSLMATYDFHDVYRPIVFSVYLSAVLLSLQIRGGLSAGSRGASACLVVFAVAIGLRATNWWARSDPHRFPGISIDWRGYRPFDHWPEGREATDQPPVSATHRLANQARRAHLLELDGYLKHRDVRGIITLDPMVLILRRRDLYVYYFHMIERPSWGTHEEAEILQSVVLARGVRFVAVTQQGLHDYHQSLRGVKSCILGSWRQQEVTCRMGGGVVVLERVWTSEGAGQRYAYGGSYSTPIRLYRIKHVGFNPSTASLNPAS